MIGGPKTSLGAKGGLWLKQFVQRLFAPSAHECSYCRTPMKGQPANPLQLCDACFRSIPWIREVLCPVCGRHELCYDCARRKNTYFVMNRSAVHYDDTMKELLAKFKYRGDERLQQVIGTMLLQAYNHYMKLPEFKNSGFDAVTFVPLSDGRLAERGFNQAEQLALTVGRHIRRPVLPLLVRTRHTAKQSFKTRSERLRDMSGVFAIDPFAAKRLGALRKKGYPLRILITDDVYTTGSTLNQCAQVLTASFDVQVYGLSWAR